jgi:hypothetical protein
MEAKTGCENDVELDFRLDKGISSWNKYASILARANPDIYGITR